MDLEVGAPPRGLSEFTFVAASVEMSPPGAPAGFLGVRSSARGERFDAALLDELSTHGSQSARQPPSAGACTVRDALSL